MKREEEGGEMVLETHFLNFYPLLTCEKKVCTQHKATRVSVGTVQLKGH